MPRQTIWIYIDIPAKTCTIHADPKCPYVQNKAETKYRGVDRLKRDGGWLQFKHIREAREYYLARFDRFEWKEHCYVSSDIVHVPKGRTGKEMISHSDGLSFNSVTDHFQKVMGGFGKRVDPQQLPWWLQVFYGLVVAIVMVCFIVWLIAYLIG